MWIGRGCERWGRLHWDMLTTALVAGVFTLLGAGITYLGTLRVQLRLQAEARATARQERIRDAYMAVLRAAIVLREVADEKDILLAGDSVEARNQRHTATLTRAYEALETADLVLRLEDSNAVVLDLFHTVRRAATSYILGLDLEAQHPSSVPLEAQDKRRQEMVDGLKELEQAMRENLGTAITTAPAVSRPWWRLWR